MTGTLSLASPWCRQAIPPDERSAIQAHIRDGYTVFLTCRGDHRAWHVEVMEHGATMFENHIVRPRVTYVDPRKGISAAIDWIDAHDTATYDGMEVPVR